MKIYPSWHDDCFTHKLLLPTVLGAIARRSLVAWQMAQRLFRHRARHLITLMICGFIYGPRAHAHLVKCIRATDAVGAAAVGNCCCSRSRSVSACRAASLPMTYDRAAVRLRIAGRMFAERSAAGAEQTLRTDAKLLKHTLPDLWLTKSTCYPAAIACSKTHDALGQLSLAGVAGASEWQCSVPECAELMTALSMTLPLQLGRVSDRFWANDNGYQSGIT